MKKLPVLLLLLIGLQAFAQKKKPVQHFKAFKTYSIDLNNDSIPDTIRLSSSLNYKDEFNRITISLTGFGKRTFIAKASWNEIDSLFTRKNKNDINSKFIYFKKAPKHNAILLFGILYASGYRGEFSIINIENNQITMGFDDNEDNDIEIPHKLADIDGDGRLDFIYRDFSEIIEKTKNGDIRTYTPYFVYTVADTCKLNKPLTKRYNQKNYVFAGYGGYGENIQIFQPKNPKQKPRVWKNNGVHHS